MFLQFWKRLGASGTAVVVISMANRIYNYVLSPTLVVTLGSVKGGALLLVLGFLLNYVIVVWYKRTTSDWFGVEWLRLEEEATSATKTGRFIRFSLRKARPIAYVALSVVDPTYGFIYMRGRKGGSRFTCVDWFWFTLSNLIGILIWIGLVSIAVDGLKSIF